MNTAEDFPEDRNAGIVTTIVSLGLHRGIALAVWLTLFGAIIVLADLGFLFGRNATRAVPLAALAVVTAASGFVVVSLLRLKSSVDGESLGESIRLVKKAGKLVPLWVTLVAWSTLGAAGVLFWYR